MVPKKKDKLAMSRVLLPVLIAAAVVAAANEFLIIGDWGNDKDYKDMVNVGAVMNAWAAQYNPHAVISLGDNFYQGGEYTYEGVNSTVDPKFTKLWTDVYSGAALDKVPWWLVLGNHDWYLKDSYAYQLEYKHWRWQMDDFFYDRRMLVKGTTTSRQATVSFIFIDTELLQYGYHPNKSDILPNFLQQGWVPSAHTAEKQLARLDQMLATANGDDYVFVVGHHGTFACGSEVQSSSYMKNVSDLLFKWSTSAYIHGHHHTMAYYRLPAASGETIVIQNGAGGNIDAACAPLNNQTALEGWELPNTYGFTRLSVDVDSAHFEFVSESGEVVFDAPLKPRKPEHGLKATKLKVDRKDPAVHFDHDAWVASKKGKQRMAMPATGARNRHRFGKTGVSGGVLKSHSKGR
ncbi:Metallo-dependent phosphatase-like protein [Chytriomyces sp. MP71]|nr:Metallo-dependent phosphatase-like protein [Chytriomyces sp. MP71]